MDDLLRSGRVQFAGVPLSREASALQRLHRVLVKYFDHLELHDRVGVLFCSSPVGGKIQLYGLHTCHIPLRLVSIVTPLYDA